MAKSFLKTDILVVGAGMAGFLAAMAASREGLDVVLVEMSYIPGGQATSTLVCEMDGFTFRGQPIYGGIENEIVEKILHVGAARHYYNVPVLSNQGVKGDKLRYNPEVLKLLLDWFTASSNFRALGGYRLQSASESKDGVTVVVAGEFDEIEIAASVAIDATGHAELTAKAGFETYLSDLEREVSTLLFRLSGTDHELLERFLLSKDAEACVQEGYDRGIFPGKFLSIAPIPGTSDASVNATRTIVDYESSKDMTRSVIEARTQIIRIIPFLKENVSGLAHSGLAAMAPQIGVREGRRIVSLTKVAAESVLEGRRYPDSVAVGCFPMGVHDPFVDEIDWKDPNGLFYIPYSAMIPSRSKRIIAAGKCICCDRMAASSVRSLPVVMNTGEVAGYASAMAVHKKKPFTHLGVQELRDFLGSKGLNVG